MTQDEHIDLDRLTTEARNLRSGQLDALDALEIVHLINSEDAEIAGAVAREAPRIAEAIDMIAERLSRGGRLIYTGAGTSGRLGVLDAVECPPTFNTDPDQVIGLIAGGKDALFHAVEGAEDSPEQGMEDLRKIKLSSKDIVVGIAASGRTPYVLGALDHARETGAATIGLACNADSELRHHAELNITPVVGPEVVTGSTRMKAGTATKMVLNMLTTGTMVRMGKTYGNLMVDVRATNEKLVERSIRIVQTITGASRSQARETLEHCEGEVKLAVIVQKKGISPGQARSLLQKAAGHLSTALEEGQNE